MLDQSLCLVMSNDHLTRNVLAPMTMMLKDSLPTKDLQRNEDISSLSIEIDTLDLERLVSSQGDQLVVKV